MLKQIAIAAIAIASFSSPALAEPWADAAPANAWQNSEANTGEMGHDAQKTDTVNFYQNGDKGAIGGSRQVGWANQTNKQTTNELPETVTGMPFLGGTACPASLALRAEHKSGLQPTRLDSLVFRSGFNDMAYGDEGTDGPPPLEDWLSIEAAGSVPDVTTGHHSNAPEVSHGP